MLAEVRHQFAHTFEADVQYRWAHSLDNGSGPYTEPDYQFLPGYNWGSSDFDSRNMIKMFGVWSPVLFHGNYLPRSSPADGPSAPSSTYHSGFPFNPTYGGIACNAFYQNAGNCNLRPAKYLGGATVSQSTNSFKSVSGIPGQTSQRAAQPTSHSPLRWMGMPGTVRSRRYPPSFLACRASAAMRSSALSTRTWIWPQPRPSDCQP